MSNATHISQDDLLLFALQFLPEEEMATAHDHLLACDDCRRQVGWLQGDLASYALTSEQVEVPAGARERLLRSIAKDKKLVAIDQRAHAAAELPPVERAAGNVVSIDDAPVRRRMGFMGWTGWAVAAAALVAAGLEFQQTQMYKSDIAEIQTKFTLASSESQRAREVLDTLTDASAKQVSLTVAGGAVPKALPEGHATYLAKKGTLVFVANHMAKLQASTTYELWLIPPGAGAVPIPAGTFRPDSNGRASMVVSTLPQGVEAGTFAITVEPEGGSATPTMPIVMSGE